MNRARFDRDAQLIAMVADGEMRVVCITPRGLRFEFTEKGLRRLTEPLRRRDSRRVDFATMVFAILLMLVVLGLAATLW
jgi:hypothetical protein